MNLYRVSRNNNQEIIQVYAKNIAGWIDQGWHSEDIDHDALVSFLTSGYESDAAVCLVEHGFKNDDKAPSYITVADSAAEIEELLEYDCANMDRLLENKYSIADAREILDGKIVWGDIPDWLEHKPAWQIIEWVKAIDKANHISADIAENAFVLDIDPTKADQQYLGHWRTKVHYAMEKAEELYETHTLKVLHDFIDWHALGVELMDTNILEVNGDYFDTEK
jgi:hypothetical protein